ncbi:MAG TPA: site-specific integrase [Candidatus Angelobacter sp.]|nr:site-specific integrase [Candidatus Angelobacter sp.]
MRTEANFAPLLQRFFTDRLMRQKQASPHTICSYSDTFRLLLAFLQKKLRKPPSRLLLEELEAPLVLEFLDEMEKERAVSPRSRNLRLAAIRSFFHYVAFEAPANAGQIQRVLAIPGKRFPHALVDFLSRPEAEALLQSPKLETWSGRRDHALMLLALQTGLRLSELTSLKTEDVSLKSGGHVRVLGKGRKERCTPLTKRTVTVLREWLKEPPRGNNGFIFTNTRGGKLSSDGVQYIMNKHVAIASANCSTLSSKCVTPHVLRHTAAMELLLAGVDRTVIALWLGHESIETTQIYLDANLAMKEAALAKTRPLGEMPRRYKPDDALLGFLKSL